MVVVTSPDTPTTSPDTPVTSLHATMATPITYWCSLSSLRVPYLITAGLVFIFCINMTNVKLRRKSLFFFCRRQALCAQKTAPIVAIVEVCPLMTGRMIAGPPTPLLVGMERETELALRLMVCRTRKFPIPATCRCNASPAPARWRSSGSPQDHSSPLRRCAC